MYSLNGLHLHTFVFVYFKHFAKAKYYPLLHQLNITTAQSYFVYYVWDVKQQ